MRSARFVPLIVLLAGCGAKWGLPDDVTPAQDPKLYFYDSDGDGWGDPDIEPRWLLFATEGYTAVAGRDCDDDDPDVTGRLGSLCPHDLPSDGTSYIGLSYGGNEYVVVDGGEVTWPGAATAACGAYGWGGGLAVFAERPDAQGVQDAVGTTKWAGFIGARPSGSNWVWDPGGSLDFAQIGYCDSAPAAADYDPSSSALALVQTGSRWCLGLPSDAGYTDDAYAHFACSRPAPDPADYQPHLEASE